MAVDNSESNVIGKRTVGSTAGDTVAAVTSRPGCARTSRLWPLRPAKIPGLWWYPIWIHVYISFSDLTEKG